MGNKVFYKYRPANNFTIALLEKREMKFSNADEYNDPFDSKLIINTNNDIDSTLQQLEETPINEAEKLVPRELIRSGNFKNQLVEASRIAARRTIMSSCFAGNSDHLLLWSHYADSHKGVCVGLRDCSSTDIPGMKFNIEDCCPYPDGSFDDSSSDGLFPVYKVNYSDSGIVEWDPSVDNFKIYMDAHRTKAKCWEYEDEYRLIVATKAFRSKILCFDPRYLVEVYLGCCIEVGFRTKVLQILKANYLSKGIDVKVFEMVRSKKRFALEKKELAI
jgi:hypothetical protein